MNASPRSSRFRAALAGFLLFAGGLGAFWWWEITDRILSCQRVPHMLCPELLPQYETTAWISLIIGVVGVLGAAVVIGLALLERRRRAQPVGPFMLTVLGTFLSLIAILYVYLMLTFPKIPIGEG